MTVLPSPPGQSRRPAADVWPHVCIITHVDSAAIIKRLVRDGWRRVRASGSHRHYAHPAKPGVVTVPHPRKDIRVGTLRNIFRQAGWDWRER